jgi:glycosyltransferase involved in cell wall biosynthesis
MRIALYNLTTTTRWGGVETFVGEIADQMAARGHEVVLFGGRGDPKYRPSVTPDTYTGRDFPVGAELGTPGPGSETLRLFRYIDRDVWRRVPFLGRQYTLTKLLERLSLVPAALGPLLRGKFDIVHIQKPYDLPVGALARLGGAKLLFGCHGKDFWPGDRFFVRFVDGAVSASRYNAQQVHQRYGIDPVVVYNGVDLSLFGPEGTGDAEVLARHGLERSSPESPALLYAGRLVRWKGVEYLLKALPTLRPSNTRLWIAGEGPYEQTLQTMARDLGIEDRVHFLGRLEQSDLAALYRSCALLVATSFVNETFGMALCEAMACGTAVVASDFGGFREVVEEGVTGLLFRPQDPGDLALRVNRLLADPALAREMGEAGRERVLGTFSWDAVADRLEEVYKCVARSST